jgi:hypothetical protein
MSDLLNCPKGGRGIGHSITMNYECLKWYNTFTNLDNFGKVHKTDICFEPFPKKNSIQKQVINFLNVSF